MCGIAGFTHFGGRPPGSRRIIAEMCASLAHRGPDGEGFYSDSEVSMGHRRLAVIDLNTGDQPMANEDGRIQVIFNGEIYNFKPLRTELEAQGHAFVSASDTEVLIHGYEQWGIDGLLHRIAGMFAFAIYDATQRKLFLARDRLGQKPLNFAAVGDTFIFASELKAILLHPLLADNRRLNFASLARYLSSEYVPTPHTLFQNIHKLRASHYLAVNAGGSIIEKPYWTVDQAARDMVVPATFKEASEEFWRLFRHAVQRRLVSDVPLGVFLSGGIDSLAVALAASQAVPGQLKSFSIGFNEPSFDESRFAQQAADHIGSQHNSHIFLVEEMGRVLPEVLDGLDEPLADASILPTYLLSRFTRSQVTVALSGDGSDEFLAGYPTFEAHRIAVRLGRPLGRLVKSLSPFLNLLPVSHANLSLEFRLKWFLRGLGLPAAQRLGAWLGAFNTKEITRLLTPEARQEALAGKWPCQVNDSCDFSGLTTLSKVYARTYLENDILVKVDRASMLHSLEVRSPFLDHELVGYMLALPDEFKFNRRWGGKAVLKQALYNLVPENFLSRPKQGFGVPISQWLAGPLSEMVEDFLSPNQLAKQGLFNPSAVARLLEQHRSKQRDNRKFLWTLLMFQAWHKKFFG